MLCYKSNELEKGMESFLTVVDINSDKKMLVCSCELGGSQWTGSLWVFRKPEDFPDLRKAQTGFAIPVGVTTAKFLPDSEKFLYGDYSATMKLVDLQRPDGDCPSNSNKYGMSYKAHNDYVTDIDIMSKETVVSCSVDRTAVLWSLEDAVASKSYPHASSVASVKGQPGEEVKFATVCKDGMFVFWDCRQPMPATACSLSQVPLTSVDWIGQNSAVVGNVSGCLSILDVRNIKESAKKCHLSFKHGIRRIRANTEHSLLACSVDDLSVSKQNNISPILESRQHKDLVSDLVWEKTGSKLWSCGWDTKLYSYDVEVPTPTAEGSDEELEPVQSTSEDTEVW